MKIHEVIEKINQDNKLYAVSNTSLKYKIFIRDNQVKFQYFHERERDWVWSDAGISTLPLDGWSIYNKSDIIKFFNGDVVSINSKNTNRDVGIVKEYDPQAKGYYIHNCPIIIQEKDMVLLLSVGEYNQKVYPSWGL